MTFTRAAASIFSSCGANVRPPSSPLRAAMLAGGLLFFAAAPPARGAEPPFRVFLIGLDGASWNVMTPLLREGRLPNIRSLMENGAYAELRSTFGITSPGLWTSILTGRPWEKHGIKGFRVGNRKTTSRDRKVRALWDILGEQGREVLVVGHLATWPAEPVRGVLITPEALEKSPNPGKTYPGDAMEGYGPPEAWLERASSSQSFRRFLPAAWETGLQSLPDEAVRNRLRPLIDVRLAWVYGRDEGLLRISEHLLAGKIPDFFTIHLWGLDHVSHAFWKHAYPDGRSVPRDEAALLGGVIPKYYEYVDDAVGRLAGRADSRTVVLLVSDHGFRARDFPAGGPQAVLSGDHGLQGVLIAGGGPIRKGGKPLDASILDVAPTVLHLMGLPAAEDMPGRILTEIIERDYAMTHPAKRIASYDSRPRNASDEPLDFPLSPEETDRLRALGYIK